MLNETRRTFVIPLEEVSEVQAILFSDLMREWLEQMRGKIQDTTLGGYQSKVLNGICPYFDKISLKLSETTTEDIEVFYQKKLEDGLSANSVISYHANIRKALQYATKKKYISFNPAIYAEKPKKTTHIAHVYNSEELGKMFELFKGEDAEMEILLTAFYGLRRSELIGLKWSNINFAEKRISISHSVTNATIDGERRLIKKDIMKTKSSMRTLPLTDEIELILRRRKNEIAKNKSQLGKAYITDFDDYVCVDKIGELKKPDLISWQFTKKVAQSPMGRIRFHDLRHSCATLLLASGVPLKDIHYGWAIQICQLLRISMHTENSKTKLKPQTLR